MFEKLKDKLWSKSFLTFALIGMLNTLSALLIYMLLVSLNIDVGLSSVIGDCLPMVLSYFLNMKFTYHKKPNLKSFLTFPLSYLPGIVLNMVITVVFVNILHSPKLLAKAFALPITIPLNYLTMSCIVKLTTKEVKQV